MNRRYVNQSATGVAIAAALTIAVLPPVGIILFVTAFFMQRDFSQRNKAAQAARLRQQQERRDQVRILALKSLR